MSIDKLYPPTIQEGISPIVFLTQQETGLSGYKILIPYCLHETTSLDSIQGIIVLFKSVSTNDTVLTVTKTPVQEREGILDLFMDEKYFSSQTYYKIQIACLGKSDDVGYYSTPAVSKCITQPELSIKGLQSGAVSDILDAHELVGEFNPLLSGEFLYTSRLQLLSKDRKDILYDSGDILFNSSNIDERGVSIQKFILSHSLSLNKLYYYRFSVKTTNNYIGFIEYEVCRTPRSAFPDNFNITAHNNEEEGYISIGLEPGDDQLVSGKYLISRASDSTGYKEWEPVYRFSLISAKVSKKEIFKDFYCNFGERYLYAIQKYDNSYTFTKKRTSNIVQSFFEYVFIIDKNQQLKLKYSPKYSTKIILNENKMNTIGGKYPFIFRNGDIKYREFQLGGLLSYLSDNENNFSNDFTADEASVNLDHYNFLREKRFREKALEWLTDGNMKVLKAPTENNAIVRLLGVNFTPNNTLSGMIGDFSANATEVVDYNYNNLIKYGLFDAEKEDADIIKDSTDLSVTSYLLERDGQSISVTDPIQVQIEPTSAELEIGIIRNGTLVETLHFDNKMLYRIPESLLPRGQYVFTWKGVSPQDETQIVIYSQKSKQENIGPTIPVFKNVYYDKNMTIRVVQYNDSFGDNLVPIFAGSKNIAYFDYLQFVKVKPTIITSSDSIIKPGFYYKKDIQEYWVKSAEDTNPIKTNNCYDIQLNQNRLSIEDTGEFYLKEMENLENINIGAGVYLECGYHCFYEGEVV